MITRSASVSSAFLSIMDLFRQALLCQVRCLPKFSPSVRFPPPCSRPRSFLLYLFLIVSRYTLNRPPPRGAVYRGIQYLQSSRIWTHSASFARTLSPSPSSRRNFPVIVVRHAHNVDPRYHTFLFHSGQYGPVSGRSLFNARQLSRSIAPHSFG